MVSQNPRAREIGRHVNDFASAERFLGGKPSKKLANNTTVYWVAQSQYYGVPAIRVRLHSTDIVEYTPKSVWLNSGGYHTATTKQRLNELVPPGVSIYQKDFEWYVRLPDGSTTEFKDGLIIGVGEGRGHGGASLPNHHHGSGPYQPKTGEKCTCRPGVQRDNCPVCEGTGMKIDFQAIRDRRASNPSRRFRSARLGSISEGTLATADLLPRFASELQSLMDEGVQPTGAMSTGWRASFKKLLKEADAWTGDDENDEAQGEEIVQELENALQAFAVDYTYFGSAEGDGASFGYWVSWDSLQEDLRSGELLKDEDVPKGYTGLAVDINDHGNTTLYRYQRGRKSEVWAVV